MTRTLSPLDETKLNPQNEEESQAATAADVAVEDEAPSKDEPARRGPGRPRLPEPKDPRKHGPSGRRLQKSRGAGFEARRAREAQTWTS